MMGWVDGQFVTWSTHYLFTPGFRMLLMHSLEDLNTISIAPSPLWVVLGWGFSRNIAYRFLFYLNWVFKVQLLLNSAQHILVFYINNQCSCWWKLIDWKLHVRLFDLTANFQCLHLTQCSLVSLPEVFLFWRGSLCWINKKVAQTNPLQLLPRDCGVNVGVLYKWAKLGAWFESIVSDKVACLAPKMLLSPLCFSHIPNTSLLKYYCGIYWYY